MLPAHAVGDLRGAVLPDLPDDHAVRLLLPNRLVDALDEEVRQLVRHIQAPAVRAGAKPAADDAVLSGVDVILVPRVVLLHRGQGVDAPPALVHIRPVREAVPGVVRALPALGGALSGVGAVAVEVAADEARVVEHAVQNHPDAPAVRLTAQGAEIVLRAQHGVDLLVVAGAVPVVFRRLKDGVEIQRLHAQTGQVVQFGGDARQTAAEEVPVAHLAAPVREIFRLLRPVLVDGAPSDLAGGVRDAQAVEPIREDLVGHPLAEPAGHLLGAVVDGQLVLAQVQGAAAEPLQGERVPHQAHIAPGVQRAGKAVLAQAGAGPGHLNLLGSIAVELEPGFQNRPGVAVRPGGAQVEFHHGS